MISASQSSGLTDHSFVEGLPASVKTYQYKGLDNFRHVVRSHITRLYDSLDTKRKRKAASDVIEDVGAAQANSQDSIDSGAYQHSQLSDPSDWYNNTDNEENDSLFPQYEERSQYIIFSIDNDSFQQNFLREDHHIFHVRLCYCPQTNILVVKMPLPSHEEAAVAFGEMLTFTLAEMGLRYEIAHWGHTTLRANDGTVKEADGAWGPRRPPRDAPPRPTLVLEIAFSDTYAKLRRDAHYWIDPARQEACIAIGIKINVQRPGITIDQYEWDISKCKPVTTNHFTIKRSGKRIYFDSENDEPRLIIPFHKLFRCQGEIPRERDIIIST